MCSVLNTSTLLGIRRSLRENQTTAESLLWKCLRRKRLNGYKFYRQYSIGPCIVDFCCAKHKLIIEVDGGYHDTSKQKISDNERSMFLCEQGYVVLRFTNDQVILEQESVCEVVLQFLKAHPSPLVKGRCPDRQYRDGGV